MLAALNPLKIASSATIKPLGYQVIRRGLTQGVRHRLPIITTPIQPRHFATATSTMSAPQIPTEQWAQVVEQTGGREYTFLLPNPQP